MNSILKGTVTIYVDNYTFVSIATRTIVAEEQKVGLGDVVFLR